MNDAKRLSIIVLPASQRDCLVREPESGMGYQLVEAEVDGKWERGIVINCELLISGADAEDYPELLKEAAGLYYSAEQIHAEAEVPLRLLYASPGLQQHGVAVSAGRSPAAIEAPEEETEEGQVFIRFSAFRNDFRITADRGLVQGSFATTLEDAVGGLGAGADIVSRYALPNPELPRFAFRVEPPAQTPLQRGTVQPANSQPGGGAEAFFSKGTVSGTVGYPQDIADGAFHDSATERKVE